MVLLWGMIGELYSTDVALHSYNVVGLPVDAMMQENLVKTWRLHYPQCNYNPTVQLEIRAYNANSC